MGAHEARREIVGLDNVVGPFKCDDEEQVIVLGGGTAIALHKLLGGFTLNEYRSRGLTDDEGQSLSRVYNVLF